MHYAGMNAATKLHFAIHGPRCFSRHSVTKHCTMVCCVLVHDLARVWHDLCEIVAVNAAVGIQSMHRIARRHPDQVLVDKQRVEPGQGDSREPDTRKRRSDVPMKIAVPDWQGRVSPVFDVAEQLVLVDLDPEEPDRWLTQRLGNAGPHDRARQLVELGVDVLVCGAISWPLEALLATRGVRVIPLVCGNVAEVVQAFRDGTIRDGRFAMPGCCRKRRQGHCRRRGGGNSTVEEIP
jgi:predicted Fe-Mo cluster-binding NifX family protein